jgi:hypothetical protein
MTAREEAGDGAEAGVMMDPIDEQLLTNMAILGSVGRRRNIRCTPKGRRSKRIPVERSNAILRRLKRTIRQISPWRSKLAGEGDFPG